MPWAPPENFSLLIPTHNRARYLARALSYYRKNAPGLSIFIADSSKAGVKRQNRDLIERAPELGIAHLDSYPGTVTPYAKMFDALDRMDTRYSAICADDDFLTPTAMNGCVSHLETHADCTVAHGRYVKFTMVKSKRGQEAVFKPLYAWDSEDEASASERFLNHLSNYPIPTMYTVMRREEMAGAMGEAVDHVSDMRLGELLPSAIQIIRGKRACLGFLHGAREAMDNSAGRTAARLPSFEKLQSQKDYAIFRARLVHHLRTAGGAGDCEASALVDTAMRTYLSRIENRGKADAYGRWRKKLVPSGASPALERMELGAKRVFGLAPRSDTERERDFELIMSGPGQMHEDYLAIAKAIRESPVE